MRVFSFNAKTQRRKGILPLALRLCVFAFERFDLTSEQVYRRRVLHLMQDRYIMDWASAQTSHIAP
jgi:hypothetical protein